MSALNTSPPTGLRYIISQSSSTIPMVPLQPTITHMVDALSPRAVVSNNIGLIGLGCRILLNMVNDVQTRVTPHFIFTNHWMDLLDRRALKAVVHGLKYVSDGLQLLGSFLSADATGGTGAGQTQMTLAIVQTTVICARLAMESIDWLLQSRLSARDQDVEAGFANAVRPPPSLNHIHVGAAAAAPAEDAAAAGHAHLQSS